MSVSPDGLNITSTAAKTVLFLSLRPSPDQSHYIGSLYLFKPVTADSPQEYIACPLTTPEIVAPMIEAAGYSGYYNGGVGCTVSIDTNAKTVEITVLNTDGSVWQKTLTPNGQFYVKADTAVQAAASHAFGLAPSVALVGTTDTQEASA
jgi:hypothetical protein